MTTLDAQAIELIGLAEKVPMPEWHYEGLNDDAKKYGAFVHTGMWGAVCICPKESPQYSAHSTNMKYIAAASPLKVAAIARAFLEARAEIERLRGALEPFVGDQQWPALVVVVSKASNDLSPLTVTATKRQFVTARAALHPQPDTTSEGM